MITVEQISNILFTQYTTLLVIKAYVLYEFLNYIRIDKAPKGNDSRLALFYVSDIFFIAFTIIFILTELCFLYVYYEDIDVYWFESITILDEIISTLMILKLKNLKEN